MKHTNTSLRSIKTVIRTKGFEASKNFYTEILKFEMVENYDDGDGSKGIILRLSAEDTSALFEISEIKKDHSYFQEAFDQKCDSDKVGIQLRTDNMEFWTKHLKKMSWDFQGPVLRPWGSYYLYLRDPDGLQIIIYKESTTE